MGLRSIWRHEQDLHPPTTRQKLNRDAISALFWIILVALLGIIILSLVGALLRFGVWGNAPESIQSNADEALSILGNVGSAAIGGLVGWLTRDQLDQKEPLPVEALPTTEASTTGPIEIVEVDELDPEDDDLIWDDEPGEVDDDGDESGLER